MKRNVRRSVLMRAGVVYGVRYAQDGRCSRREAESRNGNLKVLQLLDEKSVPFLQLPPGCERHRKQWLRELAHRLGV